MACKRKFSLFDDKVIERQEDYCVTQIKMKKYSFVWTIKNFSICSEISDIVKSPDFDTDYKYGKWHMLLDLEYKNTCRIILKSSEPLKSDGSGELQIFYYNAAGEKISVCEANILQCHHGQNLIFTHSFSKDDIAKKNLLSDDQLKLSAELHIIAEQYKESRKTYIAQFEIPECKLNDNLGNLLKTEQFSDVKLIADGHEFRVHKFVLASRSSVFAAMFEHKMLENENNCVEIIDINHQTLKEMLNFIYTGKVSNLNIMPIELLVAANKYDLKNLKIMCEEVLSYYISYKNAADILILADLHDAKHIELYAVGLIKNEIHSVKYTTGWQNLREEHSHLIEKHGLPNEEYIHTSQL